MNGVAIAVSFIFSVVLSVYVSLQLVVFTKTLSEETSDVQHADVDLLYIQFHFSHQLKNKNKCLHIKSNCQIV